MSIQKISTVFDKLITWACYLAGVLLVFSWLSVCAEVIQRYFLNKPIIWVVEVTEYILVQITFLGAAWLLDKEGHVCVDIVTSHLRPKIQAWLFAITSILGLLVALVLTIWGAIAVWGAYQENLIVPKQLNMPKYLVMLVIPIGSFLLAAQFLKRTHKALGNLNSEAPGAPDAGDDSLAGHADSH